MDFSALTRAERLVLASGLALFANGFVPWWYRLEASERAYLHDVGLSGWSLVAVLAGFAAAGSVVWRVSRGPAAEGNGRALLALGLVAVAALAVQTTRGKILWVGFWVGLALALSLAYAGWRRLREQRAGWV